MGFKNFGKISVKRGAECEAEAIVLETQPLLDKINDMYGVRPMSMVQKITYSIGHVINDILGALWFSYGLIFLQICVQLEPSVTALLLFIGQVADSIATPFAGVIVDKCGSRKKCHVIGVILVALSFPLIFQTWSKDSDYAVYHYASAVILFQIGWAVVQLSHLSLIPELTALLSERAQLTNFRYVASVCSNISLYIIAYAVFHWSKEKTTGIVGPNDSIKFQVICLAAVIIGILCSAVFHFVLKQRTEYRGTKEKAEYRSMWNAIKGFCQSIRLYQISLLHSSCKVFCSLGLIYVPFYISETRITDSGTLAVAPFLCFVASLIASLALNNVTKTFTDQKVIFLVGSTFSLLGCLFIYVNQDNVDTAVWIYASSIFSGIGGSITVVSSLCIAANFIGSSSECGAVIYGVITLSDKMLSGVAVLIIENMKCSSPLLCDYYYKFVLTTVNGLLTLIGILLLLTLPSKICSSK